MLLAHLAAAVFLSFTFIFRTPQLSTSLSFILSLARLSSGPSQHPTHFGLVSPSPQSERPGAPTCPFPFKSAFGVPAETVCFIGEPMRPQLYELLYGVEPASICATRNQTTYRTFVAPSQPLDGWRMLLTGGLCCAFMALIVFVESHRVSPFSAITVSITNKFTQGHDEPATVPTCEELQDFVFVRN